MKKIISPRIKEYGRGNIQLYPESRMMQLSPEGAGSTVPLRGTYGITLLFLDSAVNGKGFSSFHTVELIDFFLFFFTDISPK
jgi:hypothetical protein